MTSLINQPPPLRALRLQRPPLCRQPPVDRLRRLLLQHLLQLLQFPVGPIKDAIQTHQRGLSLDWFLLTAHKQSRNVRQGAKLQGTCMLALNMGLSVIARMRSFLLLLLLQKVNALRLVAAIVSYSPPMFFCRPCTNISLNLGSEKCGSAYHLSIYKAVSSSPTTWSNYGCVAEGTTGTRRALIEASYDQTNMTPATCQTLCLGYNFAGVEAG